MPGPNPLLSISTLCQNAYTLQGQGQAGQATERGGGTHQVRSRSEGSSSTAASAAEDYSIAANACLLIVLAFFMTC